MPNHITNIITINGVSKKRVTEILAAIRSDEDGIRRNSLDFNKLIPMPPELDVECGSRSDKALKLYQEFLAESKILSMMNLTNSMPESAYQKAVSELVKKYERLSGNDPDLFKFGEQLYGNIQKYGAASWYDWSVQNWGSKWNSYGYDSPAFHNADNDIEFLTAWSRVDPIMERLSQMFPDAEFFYQWADEDIGSNVGQQTWQNGEITDEFIPDHLSAGAYELAADIMGIDLAEYGLQYSEEDESYHYVDSDMDESEEPGMGGLT